VTAEAELPQVESLKHRDVRDRWGIPDQSEGSVNNPRTREENGILFNEKWVYFLEGGGRRLVYWQRYDCRGVFREAPDGSIEAESL
jgi:hypothetical protein